MKDLYKYSVIVVFALSLYSFQSCSPPGGNNPGSEYMPDMAHSIAYEANTYNYYYNNTWGSEDEYYKYAQPRLPVEGTVPRGQSSSFDGSTSTNAINYAPVGSRPYYYGDSDEERTRAMNEILENPYPITDAGMANAKELYDIYCGICHGDKGDGEGYLVREDGGVYPNAPANLLLEEHVKASNGRYYHAIIYGKNVMGSYKDKLSYEERWQVIHYIRSLQAKELKLTYNQYANTLNSIDRPAGDIALVEMEEEVHTENEPITHNNDQGHSEDHEDELDDHDSDDDHDGH